MNAILDMMMDVALLLTFQYRAGRRSGAFSAHNARAVAARDLRSDVAAAARL